MRRRAVRGESLRGGGALLLLAACATTGPAPPTGSATTFIVQFENVAQFAPQRVECVVDGVKTPPAWMSNRITCFDAPLSVGEHRFAVRVIMSGNNRESEGFKIDLKSNQAVQIGATPAQVTALVIDNAPLKNRCGDFRGPTLSWDVQRGAAFVRATPRPPEPPTAESAAIRHQIARTNHPLAPEELVDLLGLADACDCEAAVAGLQSYLRARPNLIDAAEPSAAVGALRHCGAAP